MFIHYIVTERRFYGPQYVISCKFEVLDFDEAMIQGCFPVGCEVLDFDEAMIQGCFSVGCEVLDFEEATIQGCFSVSLLQLKRLVF